MGFSIRSRTDLSVKEPSLTVSVASSETGAQPRTFDFLDTTTQSLKSYAGIPRKSQVGLIANSS